MSLNEPPENDLWDDEADVCGECGTPLSEGGLLCEECQRAHEAEEILEEIERAAIVSIFFHGLG